MPFTDDDLNDLYDLTEGHCFYCGKRLAFCNYGDVGMHGTWEADHFIPLSRNGSRRFYNLVPTCVHCNTVKANLMPWEFDPDRFIREDRNPQNYVGSMGATVLQSIFG
jgi:5-methylcytosine-specific restriction endonuclease McrA